MQSIYYNICLFLFIIKKEMATNVEKEYVISDLIGNVK